MRCFVAAFLAGESAERLQSRAGAVLGDLPSHRDVRRVPQQNYHVTLTFLGEIGPDVLPEALAAVDRLGGHPVAGRVVALTGFPRPSAARLLAAELEPEPQLEGWWASLQGLAGAVERGFRPHVTVLRFRRPRTFRPSPLPVAVDLETPRLYRSDQTPDGVRYRPVTRG